ncbi:MAG: DegV family protein [Candidatus Gastranaerophilales bacterium]|nr:DegV family protein [Candidatus Gastranaerophilales bacterium]
MREAYHIISDGSCDLPPELTAEKNVTVVPFYVSFDEEHYQKEIEEIGVRDFYQQMVDHSDVFPMTSMPSAQDYMDVFTPFAKEGTPVICICITAKFSGSAQSAENARKMLLEEYPEAKITVIDSTVDTVLQGLYVLEAVRMRDSGVSYEDTVAKLEEIKGTGRIFFTVGNMEYLKHGGRIGKVASVAGSVLGIRPVITLKQGEIFASGIGRSRKSTLNKSIDLLLHYLQGQKVPLQNYSICVGYGYDKEEAVRFRDRTVSVLREKGYGEAQIPLYQIGATIAVHTGPYPLGFGIIQKGI